MVKRQTVVNIGSCIFLFAAIISATLAYKRVVSAALDFSQKQARDRTERRLKKDSPTPTSLRPTSDTPHNSPSTPAPPVKRPIGPGGFVIPPESLFREHPTLRKAFLDVVPSRIESLFGHFYAEEKMASDEILAFSRIIIDRERKWMELKSVSEGSDGVMKEMYGEAVEQCDRELKALLGPEKFDRLNDYRGTIDARESLKTLLVSNSVSDPRIDAQTFTSLAALATEMGVFANPASSAEAFASFRKQAAIKIPAQKHEQLDFIINHYQILYAH